MRVAVLSVVILSSFASVRTADAKDLPSPRVHDAVNLDSAEGDDVVGLDGVVFFFECEGLPRVCNPDEDPGCFEQAVHDGCEVVGVGWRD